MTLGSPNAAMVPTTISLPSSETSRLVIPMRGSDPTPRASHFGTWAWSGELNHRGTETQRRPSAMAVVRIVFASIQRAVGLSPRHSTTRDDLAVVGGMTWRGANAGGIN